MATAKETKSKETRTFMHRENKFFLFTEGKMKCQFVDGEYTTANEKEIKAISVKFDTTYSYTVEFVYSEKGLITGIIIKHNEKEKYTFEPDVN